jgi:uridine kinase
MFNENQNNTFQTGFQAPEGIHCVCKRFPQLKVVTSEIEEGLNDQFHVVPGLGQFGDRYFGTDDS